MKESDIFINEMKKAQGPGAEHYNTYDLLQFPVVPLDGTFSKDKFETIRYRPRDFDGKTVIDLGACMGFFSFLALDWGARVVRGIDNNKSWVGLMNRWKVEHLKRFGKKIKGDIDFVEMDLAPLPMLPRYDVVMCHSLLHWLVMKHGRSLDDCMRWLAMIAKEKVVFEGCWDASERFRHHPNPEDRKRLLSMLNPVEFMKAASRNFKHVRFIGRCKYNDNWRVAVELAH